MGCPLPVASVGAEKADVRLVVQRVVAARVTVDEEVVGSIGRGLMVLAGVTDGDTEADADLLADKLAGLRVFPDDHGAMNLSVQQVAGEILMVSQFTLYADTRRGRRPSFTAAAQPAVADALIARLSEQLRSKGLTVASGRFGAYMEVDLINSGPVTIILETRAGRML